MSAVWHALSDPWSGEIMRRAFAEVALLGVTGGAVGCWTVLNELSYGAESLPHAMFPGLVVATLAGVPLLVGGAAGLLVAALAIAAAGRVARVGGDTAIAVVVTALFGLGALLALSPASPAGVQSLLFGDILGVSGSDLAAAAGLGVVALAVLRLLHTRLLIVGFDRTSAPALASPALADVALLLLLALSVLIAVQALGNLLVVALLIAPAAAARLVARRMLTMIIAAAAIAIVCGGAGLYASYYLRTAAGASIAAVMVGVYLIAMATRKATSA